MAQPTFLGDGSTPRRSDALWAIEQKILGATIDGGGGGGGGGGASALSGSGSPEGGDGGCWVYLRPHGHCRILVRSLEQDRMD
jgi:hypothetical protein